MHHFVDNERIYYPTGADPADPWHEHNAPTLGVYARGDGKYMVSVDRYGSRQLTSHGTLLWKPEKSHSERWCRFSFEEACRLAEQYVDTLKVGTLTWVDVMGTRV